MQAQDAAHDNTPPSLASDPAVVSGGTVAPHATVGAPLTAYNNAGLRKEIFGFATYWALSGGTLSDVQWDKVSTVSYFGLTLNGSGSFDNDAGMTGWNSVALSSTISSARAQGDRVQVTVKSFSDSTIYPIVNDPNTGQTAINSIIAKVKARGLDGVNIDFEGTSSSIYPNIQAKFTSWVGALRSQLRAALPGALLSLDAYSGSASWNDGFMRIDTLAPNVDAFFIMAYDMTQPDDLPNSPLAGPYTYTDTTSVDQFVAKSGDKSKVILGVPYYGYKFSTANAGFNAPVSAAAGAVTYSDIQGDIQCASGSPDNLAYHWDAASSTPWLSWYSPAASDPCAGNHGSWRETYFDDANSLGLKYDLVDARGIRGMGIWALGNDHGYGDLWTEISRHFAGDRWAGWYRLGGGTSGRPAVGTNADGRLEAFVRGTDGATWHAWQTSPGGGWGGWYSLGGALANDPQVVSNADGRLEVFIVGTDGQLWHMWQVTPGGGWTAFYPLGGAFTGRPSLVANSDGRLEAFLRGADGATWHVWQVAPGSGWTRPYSLGGSTPDEPAVTRNPDGRLEVFTRGGDNAIWHTWQVTPSGGWSAVYSMGGSFSGAPAADLNLDGRIEIFVTGTDHAVWHGWQTSAGGGWFPFTSLGGSMSTDTVATRDADGRLEIFAVDSQGQVNHTWQVSVGGGWVFWKALTPSSTNFSPGVGTNADGRLELLVTGADRRVWHNWQTVPNGGS